MGLKTTQLIATVFDGITRHSPEGVNFKRRAETVGWKEAVRDRDNGTWDWAAPRSMRAICCQAQSVFSLRSVG
jgi:enoyl-CoA hydratase